MKLRILAGRHLFRWSRPYAGSKWVSSIPLRANARHVASSTIAPSCPACKSCSLKITGDLFCCSRCPNRQLIDYFSVLGLSRQYNIDLDTADANYKSLQKLVHPDLQTSDSSEQICAFPAGYSALLNKAISVLKSPLERALHLLYLLDSSCSLGSVSSGSAGVESEFSIVRDNALLMEMMELNEEVEDARGNDRQLERLKLENDNRMRDCELKLQQFFDAKDFPNVRKTCERLHFLERVNTSIKDLLNK